MPTDNVLATLANPDARKMDMKNFINMPIPCLIRYEFPLRCILEEAPMENDGHEIMLDVLAAANGPREEMEPVLALAKQRVQQ